MFVKTSQGVLFASLVVVGVLASRPASADGPACWARSFDMMDNVIDPPEGGDTAFFTRAGGGPPNTFFMIANSEKAKELPGFDLAAVPGSERGCRRSTWLNGRRFEGAPYNSSINYPDVDPGQSGGPPANSDKGFPNYFRTDRAYRYMNWTTTSASAQTVNQACDSVYSIIDPNNLLCKSCLNDTKSYYLHPTSNAPSAQVFHGNWLRFYPPAHLMIRRVFKTSVVDIQRVRMGVVHFNEVTPGTNPHGGVLQRSLNPPCNLLGDTSASWNSNRGSIIGEWDGNGSTPGFGDGGRVVPTPLAEALLGIGAKYGDHGLFASTYIPPGFAPANNTSSANNNQDTICVPCQFSSVIVIGLGDTPDPAIDEHIPDYIKELNTVPAVARARLGGHCTPAEPHHCGPHLQCDYSINRCVDVNYFDNVAEYLASNDLREMYCGHRSHGGGLCQPDKQFVATYTISIGQDSALYESAAKAGGGMYFRADDTFQLKEAITHAMNDIIRRSTSFSVASVTSVQTRTTTAVFVPRFTPSVDNLWPGHLYRFKLFNEAAAGCIQGVHTEPPFTPDKLARNPNADGSCSDVYMKDADGDFIGEDDDGEFVKLESSGTYPWPPTGTLARPLWNASDELQALGPESRKIYTAIDVNNDGVIGRGEQIEFTADKAADLVPYLGLGGVSGTFCSDLSVRLLETFSSEEDCAREVINFVRGADVFDFDGDGDRTQARENMLADIFHSSPVLVVPPLSPFLCELGANLQQCAASIFRTPTPNGPDAYTEYWKENLERDQFVLVGSNGGMLHAFHAGRARKGDDPDTPVVEPADHLYFDSGTGREMWAFIPPEMLPKLKRLMMEGLHREYVDGSPMVRDIWTDLNHDGMKSKNEFRTVAITGMRGGGRTHVALDVTNPETPVFLWTNPPPGADDYLLAGESWSDFAPRPPPIVPVVARAKSPYAGSFMRQGVDSREQWVVFLGGGYDHSGLRGRSIHAYDAWTGKQVFRYAFKDAVSASDPRYALGAVTGGIAAVDWVDEAAGPMTPDWFFDTASVGDTHGNLWTLRFHLPGDDEDGDGIYDNWHAGRAFETNKGDRLQHKLPFFEMPAHGAIPDTKLLRAYIGTGDRARIRDDQGGVCDLSNVSACVRKGCSIDIDMKRRNVGSASSSGRLQVVASKTAPDSNTATAAGAVAACNSRTRFEIAASLSCGTAGSASHTYGLDCDDDDGSCSWIAPRPFGITLPFDGTTTRNRFYSFRVFDPVRQPFSSASDASAYDTNRLTDSNLARPDSGIFASADSAGFLVEYPYQNERSSGAAFVPGGNVLFWQTLTPLLTEGVCSREGTDVGALYRAHAVTGGTSVDTGTNVDFAGIGVARRTEQKVLTPPKTFITQKVITPSGEVVTVALSIEPGQPPIAVEAGRGDLYAPIRVLEVDRPTHDCRHAVTPKCD